MANIRSNEDGKQKAEADAKAKADAYKAKQDAEALETAVMAESEASARLAEAEQEPVDGDLVKMRKSNQILHVHVSAVEDHKKVGWSVY